MPSTNVPRNLNVNPRKLPQMTNRSMLKPALSGLVAGALLTMALGFTMGGWMTGSKAQSLSAASAKEAVIDVLAPMCVANYKSSSDAVEQLAALKSVDNWKHATFVEERGWATLPGAGSVNSAAASKCARLILADSEKS